jgi:hypothetical protein
MAGSTYVFLGPSLALDEAAALAGDGAIFLPPAAAGDVYRLARDLPAGRPARIAIVDGYFERMAAVWHKEILFALERRIAVFGAASMGALRAAELGGFGMVGIGRVHAGFASGRLSCDDEVAIVHAPEERGYAAMSEAMVNLRAGLGAARRGGDLDRAQHDALVALGRARFYRDRSWEQLLHDGRAAGLPRRPLDALARRVAARRPDVKADDARALLRLLARTPLRRPPRPRWRLSRTWFWEHFAALADDADGG